MTGMHCRSKLAEFKSELEAGYGPFSLVRWLRRGKPSYQGIRPNDCFRYSIHCEQGVGHAFCRWQLSLLSRVRFTILDQATMATPETPKPSDVRECGTDSTQKT